MKIAAYLLALLFVCASLPARAAGPIVLQQPDASADLAGTEVLLQAGLDRQTAKQNGLAALVAQAILRTPVQGSVALEDAVAANGGSITYAVDSDRQASPLSPPGSGSAILTVELYGHF